MALSVISALDLRSLDLPTTAHARRKEANPTPKTDRTQPQTQRPRPDQHAPQSKPRKGRVPREQHIAALIAQGITTARDLAARLRCNPTTIYNSAAYRATAGLTPLPKRKPKQRLPFVRCPGCGGKAQLLAHGYCRACDIDAHIN